MAIQIIMDANGDSRHEFDRFDLESVAQAEQRFQELTGKGFTAATRKGPGEIDLVRAFDPTAEETLFFPRLVGG
ncbi:hypothetical protein JQ596_16875 [Bradyrhizobium manausense]|uniref:hypothetical protein n=1 Tax=Bradyrhizobium manausense TaxID=989370 RepID=UPI001BAAF9C4|nr:hypothetical protein [Bradyrhizobium manausense]MBR0827206.1 hypothetical protein [Bradyrhizobium manausense]